MPSGSRGAIWSRDFLLLFGSGMLFWAAFLLFLPTISLYVVEGLGCSPAQVGLVAGFHAFGAMLIRPFAGDALDRWGRRWVYLACLLMFSVACFCYLFATSYPLLVVIRFLFGLPFGVGTAAGMTIAGDLAPPARRGEAVGLFALAQTLSIAIAPALAVKILDAAHFSGLFATAGCLALAAFLLACLLRYKPIPQHHPRLSLSSLLEPRAIPAALTVAFQGATYGATSSFLPLYGRELHIQNVGWYWLTYALGQIVARAVAGRVFDRQGPRWLVPTGYALLSCSFVLLALWRTPVGFVAAGLVHGLGFAITWPSLQTMSLAQVAPARRGAASATFFNGYDLGVSSGSYAMAFIVGALGGYSQMYCVAAMLLVAPILLFCTWTLPRYRPTAEP